jgi:uncharacterized membrane protein (DUF2068 family)
MTRDSGWVTGAIVMQFLWAFVLLALPAYLLLLTRSSAILSEQDAAEAISGLRIAAAILVLPAIVAAVAWFGLWKRKLWGWWVGLAGDLGIVAMLVYSVLDDGLRKPDWEMVGLTMTAVVPLTFLLLPAVRRSYWRVVPLEGAPAA